MLLSIHHYQEIYCNKATKLYSISLTLQRQSLFLNNTMPTKSLYHFPRTLWEGQKQLIAMRNSAFKILHKRIEILYI